MATQEIKCGDDVINKKVLFVEAYFIFERN